MVLENYSNSIVDYEDYWYDYDPSLATISVDELVVPLVVYSVTFTIGLVGNILILVAVRGQRQMAKLFSFSWQFGWVLCKLAHYSETLSVVCSVLNLTALSVERYYAVVHPMRAQYLCTTSQAKKVTMLVWVMAALLAVPTGIVRVNLPVGERFPSFWCIPDWDQPWLFRTHEIYLMVVILVIPGVMMVLSYATIICQLNVLKMERRRLTNFSTRSYKGKNYSGKEMYTMGEQTSMTEMMTRQQMEMGDSYAQVTYSDESEEAEKQICETLQNELKNEMTTKLDGSEEKKIKDNIEVSFGNKRFSSMRVADHRNNQERRFSEFHHLKISVNVGDLIPSSMRDTQVSFKKKKKEVSPRLRIVNRERETKQVIYMLILIMLLFFLCWSPILTFNLLASFELLGADNMGTSTTTKNIKTAFSLLSYSNSCLNPVIYGFMSKNFRKSFLSSICMKKKSGNI